MSVVEDIFWWPGKEFQHDNKAYTVVKVYKTKKAALKLLMTLRGQGKEAWIIQTNGIAVKDPKDEEEMKKVLGGINIQKIFVVSLEGSAWMDDMEKELGKKPKNAVRMPSNEVQPLDEDEDKDGDDGEGEDDGEPDDGEDEEEEGDMPEPKPEDPGNMPENPEGYDVPGDVYAGVNSNGNAVWWTKEEEYEKLNNSNFPIVLFNAFVLPVGVPIPPHMGDMGEFKAVPVEIAPHFDYKEFKILKIFPYSTTQSTTVTADGFITITECSGVDSRGNKKIARNKEYFLIIPAGSGSGTDFVDIKSAHENKPYPLAQLGAKHLWGSKIKMGMPMKTYIPWIDSSWIPANANLVAKVLSMPDEEPTNQPTINIWAPNVLARKVPSKEYFFSLSRQITLLKDNKSKSMGFVPKDQLKDRMEAEK